MNFTH